MMGQKNECSLIFLPTIFLQHRNHGGDPTVLVLTRRKNESIVLTLPGVGAVKVMVCSIGDEVVRIGIEAPAEVRVLREELLERSVATDCGDL